MPESLKLKISERDDFADLLGLIPTWIISAIIWYAFTKLVVDSLTDKKPGTELNLLLLGADIITSLPPGVVVAAQVDVFMAGLELKKDIVSTLADFGGNLANLFGIEPKDIGL